MTLVTFLKLTLLCDTISSSALFSKVESKSICKEEELEKRGNGFGLKMSHFFLQT